MKLLEFKLLMHKTIKTLIFSTESENRKKISSKISFDQSRLWHAAAGGLDNLSMNTKA